MTASTEQLLQREPSPLENLVVRTLKLTEILPQEKHLSRKMRWAAHNATIALKLGEKGRYFLIPKQNLTITGEDAVRIPQFEKAIETTLKGGGVDWTYSFPNADQVMVTGIMRRFLHHSGNRKVLKGSFKKSW